MLKVVEVLCQFQSSSQLIVYNDRNLKDLEISCYQVKIHSVEVAQNFQLPMATDSNTKHIPQPK